MNAAKQDLWEVGYFTILIGWSETPTKWHPTSKSGPFSQLSRGAFRTEEEAKHWGDEHLEGQPYEIKHIPGETES